MNFMICLYNNHYFVFNFIILRLLEVDETSLLKRGLNFAVTPTSIPMKSYVIGIESACKYLGPNSKQAETLRSDCVKILKHAKNPKSNISQKEQLVLRI